MSIIDTSGIQDEFASYYDLSRTHDTIFNTLTIVKISSFSRPQNSGQSSINAFITLKHETQVLWKAKAGSGQE